MANPFYNPELAKQAAGQTWGEAAKSAGSAGGEAALVQAGAQIAAGQDPTRAAISAAGGTAGGALGSKAGAAIGGAVGGPVGAALGAGVGKLAGGYLGGQADKAVLGEKAGPLAPAAQVQQPRGTGAAIVDPAAQQAQAVQFFMGGTHMVPGYYNHGQGYVHDQMSPRMPDRGVQLQPAPMGAPAPANVVTTEPIPGEFDMGPMGLPKPYSFGYVPSQAKSEMQKDASFMAKEEREMMKFAGDERRKEELHAQKMQHNEMKMKGPMAGQ